jgi:two-component system, NarL family, nitrate/nitrite response regulator NarL
MSEVGVLVVGERLGLAQSLLLAAGQLSGTRVLGPVPGLDDALGPISAGSIDVVVVDLDRTDGGGLEIIATLRDARPQTRILAAGEDQDQLAVAALAAGACGILPVSRCAHGIIDAIRRAVAGEVVLPDRRLPSVVDRLHVDAWRRTEAARIGSLTPRELEVLTLLAQGESTGGVAVRLGISSMTVQSHVKSVLAKLSVHSKLEAVRIAWRCGAIAVPASA